MLIWEFPPEISGGLGIAGAGIVKSLTASGCKVDVLLPKVSRTHASHGASLLDASTMDIEEALWTQDEEVVETVKKMEFGSHLVPYLPPEEFAREVTSKQSRKIEVQSKERVAADGIELEGGYRHDVLSQVRKYALLAYQQAQSGAYDIVHVHDWLTFPAGALIQAAGQHVVFHVHSLETDRNGIYGNAEVSQIEREALTKAKYIVAVSNRTRAAVSHHFEVNEDTIEVIPNGLDEEFRPAQNVNGAVRIGFVGRLTHQKGPNYFLDIAKELKARLPDGTFELIGEGYLMPELKKKAHHLNLSKTINFRGFLSHDETMEQMKHLDLLVFPSVSEPFGLVALEAIAHGVPVVASPNTGIAEFVGSIPQVENWNVYEAARLCYRLLSEDRFRQETVAQCQEEAKKLSWDESGARLQFLYHELLRRK